MLRQDIRIGDYSEKGADLVTYKYVADLYKAGVDVKDNIQKQYVMIRKYNVINNIIYDTDLYIIERSILEESPESIVFPMTNKSFIGFSNDRKSFNENYNDMNFRIGGGEVYEMYTRNANDKSFSIAEIPCDIVRIYHPHNKKELKSVIYIDTLVNAVKIHLFCRPYLSLESHSEEDFQIDGVRYSEYVECCIPNIEYIMSGNVYYEERLSLVNVGLQESLHHHDDAFITTSDKRVVNTEVPEKILYEKNYSNITSDLLCMPSNGLAKDATYAAFKLYTIPFIIDDTNKDELIKRYLIDVNDSVAQDYVTYPLRITIAPYSFVDETTKIYINDSRLEMNSDVMQDNAMMTLAARSGFDDSGVPSLICKFQFPGKEKFNNFREAYEHFYRVDLRDYTGIVESEDDIDEEDWVEQKQCGFVLSIYTDFNMTSVLYQEAFELDDPESQLDDFAFQLTNIFENWDQLPDILIMDARFMDRWLGNVIASNPVIIHNESYKYFVNQDGRSIISWNEQEETHHTTKDMDLSKINFIDKIHCTIRRTDDGQGTAMGSNNGPKVLYKPVFYRTQDLQNITLHTGLTQNIGIALAEYMTKVEAFKLQIGDQSIVESARNDIYAIFSVNASILNEGSGTYHIANQDGEYISSGHFTIIP